MFFAPFVIGWIVAMIANPLVHYLEKHVKIVRKLGSVVLVAGVLALVITAIYLLIVGVSRMLSGFLTDLPGLYAAANTEINAALNNLSAISRILPDSVTDFLIRFTDGIGSQIGDIVQSLAATAGGAVARSLPDILVSFICMILSSYFFLADHDELVIRIKQMIPESVKKYVRMMKADILKVIYGYFLAQFKIMFVVALVMVAGLLFLKVKYAVPLAIAIAMLDFLPVFGTGTVLIPWALVKLFTGEYPYALGLLILYGLSQGIRQLIQPKIVGDSMGLPPLTTLFLLFIGYKVKGLGGMILAVPVGIVFIRLYEYGVFDNLILNVKLLMQMIHDLRTGENSNEMESDKIQRN